MQAIAAWLVASPQNAVLGLAVTLLLPAPQLTSGVIMVLLVLAQGPKLAIIEGSIAAAVLLTVSLIFGVSIASISTLMAGTWLPASATGPCITVPRVAAQATRCPPSAC